MSITPEFALLLDAAVPLPGARSELRFWNDERWDHAVNLARWHRLAPALHCHLRSDDSVPVAVAQGLESAYVDNAARNLFLRAATRRLIDALAAAGVPVILLKGAALVETVYPDPAEREMLDVDLLVPPQLIERARDAVQTLGYRALPELGTARAPSRGRHHDAALVDGEHLLAVELHRHITIDGEGRSFDIEELWRRARSVEGHDALVPAAEDLLLHVCFHFTRNRLGGSYGQRNTGGALAQVADIARIVEHESLDWTALAAHARGYGLGARVFLALFAARELGVPVPVAPLARLRPAGFDPDVGRRLVALRVLRGEDHLPVRSVRWMVAPPADALRRRWTKGSGDPLALARAYVRRARAHAPLLRSAIREPRTVVQDHRLNDQIHALENRG